ncbi:carbonic anhydrase family protein [Propionivibrio sp.]|uniref:carbonic anhydrase n=1 Tax=Propionivibrio sp. TaxID=2212460 RepID=UPI002601A8DC|nr:carbonic anhydrase family protein [Propionivibrio sp.]
MRAKTNSGSPVLCIKLCAALIATVLPAMACAAWQVVASEQGKRVEIDRASIVSNPNGEATATGRIVLDKPIVDPKTSSAYRIIEVMSRYDCTERTHSTLKRSYFKEEGELVRQEEVKIPYDMPVRSGTPDDKLLREVCRPKSGSPAVALASRTAEKVNEAAGALRKENESLVEKEVQKELRKITSNASSALHGIRKDASATDLSNIPWSYDGTGGADNWSRLKAEYATCGSGRRQSPIDLRDGIALDLEPIQFAYRPASFRVVDSGRNLQMTVYGGSLGLLGKNYELIRIQFHRPSEITIDGRAFAMDAQLVHKSDDGKLAIAVVLLDTGTENPVIQMALNNLPLEKGGEVAPPAQTLDLSRLLPGDQRYFTFMGSLTTPPCTEDVLWLVLKQPQQLSPEQLAIFERLYKPNARPVQPGWGRIIKESR